MTNNKFLVCLISVFCFITSRICAQPLSAKDSVYILICRVELENGRPEVGFILYKNLDSLPQLSAMNRQNDAVCALLQHGIWFEEPFFTFTNHRNDYGFKSQKEGDDFFDGLSEKVKKLSTQYASLWSKKFSNNKTIQIDCVHLMGDFWVIDSKTHDMNILDHSIKAETGCYGQSYWYNLKDVFSSQKLSHKEIVCIQKKIGK